jgi:DEAD/DEAH box helicase domain-containing protein
MDHTSPQRVVFDIETKFTFDEVGGFGQPEKLGVSYVGVYSYSQDKLFGFTEEELPKLERILQAEQPMLVGFNSIHFDVPVLQPYFSQLDLTTLPHVDILRDIDKALGHRVKLDNVAQATLYEGKSGSGLDAIRWYREGDMESLAKYCLDDVRVTRDVYEYGLRHGRIYYPSGGEKLPIPMRWVEGPYIQDLLQEAFKRHEQLEVEYFAIDHTGTKEIVTDLIDILDFDGNRVEALSARTSKKLTIPLANIWAVRETGHTSAHQVSLF